ncbi:MAG: hypothetical protein ACREOU_15770 [Candidatus Eiseniibacteriota bacterium]
MRRARATLALAAALAVASLFGSVDFGSVESAPRPRKSSSAPPALVGRVSVLPGGGPAAGVAIALEPADSLTHLARDADGFERTMLRAASDSLGRFRFTGLSPGLYRVGVIEDELPEHRTSGKGDRTVRHPTANVRTRPDTLRFSIRPAGCVTGRVTGHPEAGLAGDTWIFVTDVADTLFEASGPVAPDGSYRFCRVPAGVPVSARAALPDGRARRTPSFEVRAGGLADVRDIAFPVLDSTTAGALSFHVTQADGSPAAGATIELASASDGGDEEFRRELQTDDAGRTPEVWLRAGRYRARPAGASPSATVYSIEFDHLAGAPRTVDIRLPR